MKYRSDIQGLRAIAVLSVFLFHLNKDIMPGGFIGVDIFFVISGFLISSIIFTQKEKKIFSFKEFYVSRIKRIVPAYYIMILVSMTAVSMVYLYSDIYPFRKSAATAVLFVSNTYFSTLDTYFGATSAENPLLHTWTLAIEMQFYLLLPLAIIFFSKKNIRIITIGAIVVLTAYCQYNLLAGGRQDQMYYSLLARIPEFLLGVSINLLSPKLKQYFGGNNVVSVVGLVLIAGSLFFINEQTLFPGLVALIPCLGACFLLLSEGSVVNKVLSQNKLVYIGEISYSLYLWHWPVFAVLRYYNNDYYFSPLNALAACALVVILSIVSYQFFEKPIRKATKKKLLLILASMGCLLIFTGFAMTSIGTWKQYPFRYSEPLGLGLETHAENMNNTNKLNLLGNVCAKDTILLIGDSHGLVYKVYFDELGKQNDFALQSITNNVYPPIPGIDKSDFENTKTYTQYRHLAAIVEDNVTAKKVILFCMSWKNADRFTGLPQLIDDFIKRLPADQNVIFLEDYPVSEINPLREYRDLVKDATKDYRFRLKTYSIPQNVMDVLNRYHNAHVLNVNDNGFYKDAPFYNDTLMYYDRNHLNRYAAENLAKLTGSRTNQFISKYFDTN
ncbi:peptidoglycan/LPS O-acetylase OafA/YrhL [Dysgonomonas sp. PH5-45]|uniref:acyltransferase family protein n=1 Tax=unclassified Dysgonomonas TaxID=2630389 RepID=UPI002474A8A6|nr:MULTISPECIES: acyltransferase family protein [unclassified Dysgonomonas]MDH6355663.1 peptidoglycan/LPS O-acetylase OafA/YrhL [Dysgonomonas sp. PH5-45]MDH6388554.1 peptidoglycan/LPS O-acetylase OafA/YrhL [Dysgonomonas sp. PH5-37]